jgi:hypothetical protein
MQLDAAWMDAPHACSFADLLLVDCVDLLAGYRAMTKSLDSTAVYAYTTLISVLICTPLALLAEGSGLVAGAQAAIAKV